MVSLLSADAPQDSEQRLSLLDADQTLRLFFDQGTPLFSPPFELPVLRSPDTPAGRIVDTVA
jgi:hypothetical protein